MSQSDHMDLSLVARGWSGDAAQGGLDSLVEGDEVGSVEGTVTHTVLVVLNGPGRAQHQPQQKVICNQQKHPILSL